MIERNINSSTLASGSPAQLLRPAPNGSQFSCLVISWPSELMYRWGLNSSGFSKHSGSRWTDSRSTRTRVSFGTRYPQSVVSFMVRCGTAASTTLPSRCISMIVAWISGRFERSSRLGNPVTANNLVYMLLKLHLELGVINHEGDAPQQRSSNGFRSSRKHIRHWGHHMIFC